MTVREDFHPRTGSPVRTKARARSTVNDELEPIGPIPVAG